MDLYGCTSDNGCDRQSNVFSVRVGIVKSGNNIEYERVLDSDKKVCWNMFQDVVHIVLQRMW